MLTARSYLEDWLSSGLTKNNLFFGLEVYSRLDLDKLNQLVKQELSAFKQDAETGVQSLRFAIIISECLEYSRGLFIVTFQQQAANWL